ncbi:MAG: hypothetical protein IPN19_08225 [Elusimicrobia bacterium]|nr:hypothetical protein [Elusimicrobiota bacterium]
MTPPAVPAAEPASLRAETVYNEAAMAARLLYRTLETEEKNPTSLFWPENIIRKIWLLLNEGSPRLLALTLRSTPDHFLFSHVANMTVLSMRLGLAVGLEEDDLITLGLSAFLNEMGLAPLLELVSKPTTLTDDEVKRIRQHVEAGVKMLDLFAIPENSRKATLRQIIGQCHERVSGTGYPKGLKKEAIHPFAKLIGIVDSYEALTHPRPWRSKTLPADVLKRFVEENPEEFDPLLIRALVDSLSLYPPGSFVKLNTGETAQVAVTIPGLPLRPQVRVIMDKTGQRVLPPRTVSLAAQPTLFVTEPIDETTLSTPSSRLRLELRAQTLWVKGL